MNLEVDPPGGAHGPLSSLCPTWHRLKPIRARLNKDLAARLVDRSLDAKPTTFAESRACAYLRASPCKSTLVIAPPSPSNVCALAGL